MPTLLNPFQSFGTGSGVADAWVEVGRVTSVSGGALTISGLDLSTYLVVRLFINGVTVTTDDSRVSLQFIIAGSTVTSGYRFASAKIGISVAAADVNDNTDPSISLTSVTAAQGVGNASTESLGAVVTCFQLGSQWKRCSYRSAYANPAGNIMTMFSAAGQLDDTGAVTGFTLIGASNLTGGSMIAMGLV